jgi:hypothetical protein
MEFLETSLNDFDILVVTETHLDNQINDSDITLDSFPKIFPTSSIKWSVKSKNNAFTFGFRPWSKRRQTQKREHRRLVLFEK